MEFIEQIDEIANAKPQEEKQSELEKASKLIQEEKVKREMPLQKICNCFVKNIRSV